MTDSTATPAAAPEAPRVAPVIRICAGCRSHFEPKADERHCPECLHWAGLMAFNDEMAGAVMGRCRQSTRPPMGRGRGGRRR